MGRYTFFYFHFTRLFFDAIISFTHPTQNRMRRFLALFDSIINDPYFARTSIILFLTKIDVFRDKVTTGKVNLLRHNRVLGSAWLVLIFAGRMSLLIPFRN
jgi:hypothetical protein